MTKRTTKTTRNILGLLACALILAFVLPAAALGQGWHRGRSRARVVVQYGYRPRPRPYVVYAPRPYYYEDRYYYAPDYNYGRYYGASDWYWRRHHRRHFRFGVVIR